MPRVRRFGARNRRQQRQRRTNRRVRRLNRNNARQTGLVRFIKQVISKDAEKKSKTDIITVTNFNSGISSSTEVYSMFPDVNVGTNSYTRIGDTIRATYLKIAGYIKISNTATMPQPKYAFMYFLEDRRVKDNMSGSTNQFLNYNGAPTAFDGTMATAFLPIDTTRYTVIKKIVIKLTQNFAPGSTQSGLVDQEGALMRYFSVKVPMKGRLLRYDSNGATTLPENANLVWACGYLNYNNAVDIALQDVSVQLQKTLYYRDD